MPLPDSAPMLTVADIKTDVGNDILTQLVRAGWVVKGEYALTAFDKGIDYDSYTLARDGARLEFEWSNWDEWQIRGPREIVQAICAEFGVELRGEDG
jgi:hypothetical protein